MTRGPLLSLHAAYYTNTRPNLTLTSHSYAIELDSNRDNWLTIVTSQPNGRCSNDTDQRVSVTFDDDMRSGCYIR